jgi:hypothetical protein
MWDAKAERSQSLLLLQTYAAKEPSAIDRRAYGGGGEDGIGLSRASAIRWFRYCKNSVVIAMMAEMVMVVMVMVIMMVIFTRCRERSHGEVDKLRQAAIRGNGSEQTATHVTIHLRRNTRSSCGCSCAPTVSTTHVRLW